MWSWLFDKKPSDAQSTSGLSLEDDKLFEKNPPDVKLVYDIGGKIASGVFGTVYQATHKMTKELVAVKIAVPESPKETSDHINEVKIQKSLKHPNVVPLICAWKKGSEFTMVFEFCCGGTAADLYYHSKDAVPEPVLKCILRDLFSALKFIHSLHIIHRDVKGANILLTSTGQAKLTDFGVSVQMRNANDKRKSLMGTPFWLAPEVILAEATYTPYGTEADIWSAGVVCYEMRETSPPHFGLPLEKILVEIPKSPAPKLNAENCSAALCDLASRCLTKSSLHRPPAAALLNHEFFRDAPDYSVVLAYQRQISSPAAKNSTTPQPSSSSPVVTTHPLPTAVAESPASSITSAIGNTSRSTIASAAAANPSQLRSSSSSSSSSSTAAEFISSSPTSAHISKPSLSNSSKENESPPLGSSSSSQHVHTISSLPPSRPSAPEAPSPSISFVIHSHDEEEKTDPNKATPSPNKEKATGSHLGAGGGSALFLAPVPHEPAPLLLPNPETEDDYNPSRVLTRRVSRRVSVSLSTSYRQFRDELTNSSGAVAAAGGSQISSTTHDAMISALADATVAEMQRGTSAEAVQIATIPQTISPQMSLPAISQSPPPSTDVKKGSQIQKVPSPPGSSPDRSRVKSPPRSRPPQSPPRGHTSQTTTGVTSLLSSLVRTFSPGRERPPTTSTPPPPRSPFEGKREPPLPPHIDPKTRSSTGGIPAAPLKDSATPGERKSPDWQMPAATSSSSPLPVSPMTSTIPTAHPGVHRALKLDFDTMAGLRSSADGALASSSSASSSPTTSAPVVPNSVSALTTTEQPAPATPIATVGPQLTSGSPRPTPPHTPTAEELAAIKSRLAEIRTEKERLLERLAARSPKASQ